MLWFPNRVFYARRSKFLFIYTFLGSLLLTLWCIYLSLLPVPNSRHYLIFAHSGRYYLLLRTSQSYLYFLFGSLFACPILASLKVSFLCGQYTYVVTPMLPREASSTVCMAPCVVFLRSETLILNLRLSLMSFEYFLLL